MNKSISEVWMPVKGYEGLYEVSSFGKVKRLSGHIYVIDKKQKREYVKPIREKIIHQFFDSAGYKTVNLSKKRTRVHVIVAEAFLEKPR